MDVFLSLGYKFVNAACVLGPFQIKVFPEGCGAKVNHAAPVLADDVHGLGVIAALGKRLQHVVAVEGGEAFGAAHEQIALAGLFGVHDASQRHQGRGLFEVVVGHDFLVQPADNVLALLCVGLVLKDAAQLGGVFQRPYQQGTVAGLNAFLVGT